MAVKSCLGLHYGPAGLVAVLVEQQADACQRAATYRLSHAGAVGGATSPNDAVLAADHGPAELVPQLRQTHRRLPPVALSLAGALYHAQVHHSDFTDLRQIRQTIKFDVEEDSTFDAESLAVCFQTAAPAAEGTNLIVYSLQRTRCQEILDQFEQAGLDPLVAEPDIAAWVHYLTRLAQLPADEPVLAVAAPPGGLYLVLLAADRAVLLARSLLCPSPEHVSQTLATEIRRSLALWPENQQPQRIHYHPGGLVRGQVETLLAEVKLPWQPLPEPDLDVACALGVAVGWLNRTTAADFRADGMPVRTVLAARRRALYGLAAAAVLLLAALLFAVKTYANRCQSQYALANERLGQAYLDAAGKPPAPSVNMARMIGNLHRQWHNAAVRQGVQAQTNSASHTFTLLFNTLASLGEEFDLRLDLVRLSPKDALLQGSIPNLETQFVLDAAIRRTPELRRESWAFDPPAGDRRPFSMNLSVAQTDRAEAP